MNSGNEAKLENKKIKDHSDCEECLEDYYFTMRDRYHEFNIGLGPILNCLKIAQEQGAVPTIDSEWWVKVVNRYVIEE